MVYLALRRKTRDISYFDDGGECDFVTRDRLTFGTRRIDVIPFWDWNP